MAIFMALSVLGISTMVKSRDIQIAKDAAEQVKSEIRKVQVKAISTEGGPSCPAAPKMWGLRVTDTGIVETYYWCPTNSTWYLKDDVDWDNNLTNIDINTPSGGTSGICYVFNAPYGRFYQKSSCSGVEAMGTDVAVEQSMRPLSGLIAGNTSISLSFKSETFTVFVDGARGATEVR